MLDVSVGAIVNGTLFMFLLVTVFASMRWPSVAIVTYITLVVWFMHLLVRVVRSHIRFYLSVFTPVANVADVVCIMYELGVCIAALSKWYLRRTRTVPDVTMPHV